MPWPACGPTRISKSMPGTRSGARDTGSPGSPRSHLQARYNDIAAWFGRVRGTGYRPRPRRGPAHRDRRRPAHLARLRRRKQRGRGQRPLAPALPRPRSQRQVTAAWPGTCPDERQPAAMPAGRSSPRSARLSARPGLSSQPPRAAVPDRLRVVPRSARCVIRLRQWGCWVAGGALGPGRSRSGRCDHRCARRRSTCRSLPRAGVRWR